jgi:hypothetical protein
VNRTYHSRQTKHMICFVCLEWYVLSIRIKMFYLSGLICFVCLEWYVLSIRIKMFCLSGLICFVCLELSFQTDKTYHSRQTKHINPDRQNISFHGLRCFVYLDWYVFSVWNDIFCLSEMICCPSGLKCFVYLDWYVLSIWNDMFCPSGIIPDRQNISIQIDKTS